MVDQLSAIVRKYRVGGSRTVGDLQAEQAAEQFHRDARGAAAFVEKRIEFDEVD
jgi:hypothetical protein